MTRAALAAIFECGEASAEEPREIVLSDEVGSYRGRVVGVHRLDVFVAGEIVVELKAVKDLTDTHFAVVRSDLRAVGRSHGLILNFAKTALEARRVRSRPES